MTTPPSLLTAKRREGQEPGSIRTGVVPSDWQLSLRHTRGDLAYHKVMEWYADERIETHCD